MWYSYNTAVCHITLLVLNNCIECYEKTRSLMQNDDRPAGVVDVSTVSLAERERARMRSLQCLKIVIIQNTNFLHEFTLHVMLNSAQM